MKRDSQDHLRRRALAALERRARSLSLALYTAFDADNWVDIEPETFANVGRNSKGDDLIFNKLTRDEAEDATNGMLEVLMEALLALEGE